MAVFSYSISAYKLKTCKSGNETESSFGFRIHFLTMVHKWNLWSRNVLMENLHPSHVPASTTMAGFNDELALPQLPSPVYVA